MVSILGVRVKFSEGKRVLCYEPDPTKAKFLYDSKVLEVVFNKNGKGCKQIEYLIHFQGWNASWDWCVLEDFVLKNTDKNRDLQKQLADKAQVKLLHCDRGGREGWPLSEGSSSTEGEDEDEEDKDEAASEGECHFPLVILDNLRAVLERDHHLVNDKNK